MSVDEIIHILNEFVPFPEDDPVNDNESFLVGLMDRWKTTEGKNTAIPSIFRFMERYPHARLGPPGPLIHALEADDTTEYATELRQSLMRRPTLLTLWMYNRLINAEKDRRLIEGHISRMRLFTKHPLADEPTKKQAQDFINHQLKRLE
ncbi:MAG: hypothetical protein Q8927_02410 [Bacteroidota bacterium]|nr:hypothetical protein [Bacteroidota bacterium]MDP4247926.1 hypothetical protein [Bacteroidota bacterium]